MGQMMRLSQKTRASASVAATMSGETCGKKEIWLHNSQKQSQRSVLWFSLISHGLLPVEALNGHQPPWALCPAGIRSCRAQEEPIGTFHGRFGSSWCVGRYLSGFKNPVAFPRLHQSGSTSEGLPWVASGYILRKVDRMLISRSQVMREASSFPGWIKVTHSCWTWREGDWTVGLSKSVLRPIP